MTPSPATPLPDGGPSERVVCASCGGFIEFPEIAVPVADRLVHRYCSWRKEVRGAR